MFGLVGREGRGQRRDWFEADSQFGHSFGLKYRLRTEGLAWDTSSRFA